jgi:putative transposase
LKDICSVDVEQDRWSISSRQQILRRLDRAIRRVLRRVRAGNSSGYPFSAGSAVRHLTFINGDGATWFGQQVRLRGVGHIKVRLHRPVCGTVKQISLTRAGRRWFVKVTASGVTAGAGRPRGCGGHRSWREAPGRQRWRVQRQVPPHPHAY